jgi:hypothetical protein
MNTAWIVSLALLAAGEPGPSVKPVPTPAAPGQDVWRMTLPEAIRIGLRNSECLRVVADPSASSPAAKADGVGMTVEWRGGDGPACRSKAALMAHVRSIAQQYWALSQQQVQVWAREAAVKLCEEVVARERAESARELTHGTTADLAEAQQVLEQCRLALVAATSDTITTERQLRNILGLPPVDDRRIVPATAPVEAKVEPDWEGCLAAMMENQPDILEQRAFFTAAEERAARGDEPSPVPAGLPAAVADAFGAQMGKNTPDRQRAILRQVVHQTTHSLARFFLEIDANHKQFQTARKLREQAQAYLDQARASFEQGKTGFGIDRVLDAIVKYADAVAQEAQYKSTYNTCIAMLEEAKGTLLAECRIVVLDPSPRGIDSEVKPASFTPPPDAAPAPPRPEARPSPSPAGARVIRYDISLEGGPAPIQLKGTVSIGTPAGR